MRSFRFIFSLYFLPVFFFTVAVSPNINGERIGLVLLSVYILLIPATNYIVDSTYSRASNSDKSKPLLSNFIGLLMFVVAIYLGWQINWQFNIMQMVYLLFIAGAYNNLFSKGKFNLLLVLVLGSILFSATYIGLNQYGFTQLLSLHNFAVILYCGLLIAPIFYMVGDGLKLLYLIKTVRTVLLGETLSFVIFFFVSYKWEYAVIFAIAMVPSALWLYKMYKDSETTDSLVTKRFAWLRLVYATSMAGFFIYFFLDSTQVLQAIRGGY
jgi:hypothetical protein